MKDCEGAGGTLNKSINTRAHTLPAFYRCSISISSIIKVMNLNVPSLPNPFPCYISVGFTFNVDQGDQEPNMEISHRI